MSWRSVFDRLPNELYLSIFDYLNPIDLLYSFSNLNFRFNSLLKSYSCLTCKSIDLTKLNPHVFQYYCSLQQLNNEIYSIKLNNNQLKFLSFSSNNKLTRLNFLLENDYHLYLNDQFIIKNLQILKVRHHALTWQKPLIICQYLQQVTIHLRNHWDLIDLLNSLPIVEKVHATIDYDVTSCRDSSSLEGFSYSNKLKDFSYIIHSNHGLIYFVTDYSVIELLIQNLTNLLKLRLYIIGCMNTIIDGYRLENNLLKFLPKLNKFDIFIQSYGGNQIKSMEQFHSFKWNFASYTNQLTDMHFLFTLPFKFQYLHECLNEYFINSIKTNFQKSNENLLNMNYVKHVDLSCSITENFIILIQKSFPSLESICFSSSTTEYLCSTSLYRQSHYLINSIRTIIFQHSSLNLIPFIRHLPNLNKLILNQSLLNHLLEKIDLIYISQITELHVYKFQRHSLENILNGFPNIRHLILKTLQTNDEPPVRSFIDNRCHHKHRPISACDILEEVFKKKLNQLEKIEIGCYFERDEQNLEGILSRLITKYIRINTKFHINTEDYKSTRCGSIQILFF
ncbi:unnamed protein product [Rotaria socialis]|uniref:F-box domain-containing protein n=3 Tax=Rotaria socialis TaxID=392032 RepID=A0A820U7U3_9BILA|nr:unnamed protein product [Rotaria socialis]CAF3163215.1 unnamed protein product [Rotaria socialis]CAF3310743.1 unnamed protein product [Rotaria socialis]CAF3365172.1 unnamed protein product [Rotaria socialis]CAF3393380.1 unnamed protein product [Rotaria socialis]